MKTTKQYVIKDITAHEYLTDINDLGASQCIKEAILLHEKSANKICKVLNTNSNHIFKKKDSDSVCECKNCYNGIK
jgi:hypothetical protein